MDNNAIGNISIFFCFIAPVLLALSIFIGIKTRQKITATISKRIDDDFFGKPAIVRRLRIIGLFGLISAVGVVGLLVFTIMKPSFAFSKTILILWVGDFTLAIIVGAVLIITIITGR